MTSFFQGNLLQLKLANFKAPISAEITNWIVKDTFVVDTNRDDNITLHIDKMQEFSILLDPAQVPGLDAHANLSQLVLERKFDAVTGLETWRIV